MPRKREVDIRQGEGKEGVHRKAPGGGLRREQDDHKKGGAGVHVKEEGSHGLGLLVGDSHGLGLLAEDNHGLGQEG